MATKKVPAKKKAAVKAKKKTAAKKAAPIKKAPAKKSPAKAADAVSCLTGAQARQVIDGCMGQFGVGAVSKATPLGNALPGLVNAFCSCVRITSGISNAACNGGMTFQQVEIGLVC